MSVDLEAEIRGTRAQLAAAKADEAKFRLDAETLVAKRKGEGAKLLEDVAVFNEIDAAYKLADGKADEVSHLQSALAKALGWVGEAATESKDGSLNQHEARTMIARLTQSPEYARMRAEVQSRGIEGANMGSVSLASREETMSGLLRLNTTVDNTSGSGGGLIWSDRKTDIVVPIAQRRVRLLDLITVGTTDSDTVEFVRETTHTDAAAETAYGTAIPESAYGYTKDSTTVKRVGHFVPATEGALMDAGQLDTILRANLQSGVLRRTESQIYSAGGGTGEDFLSILDASRTGVQTQARGSLTYHDVFHKAITKIRLAKLDGENDPNAFVINPTDWESLVLETDDNGNYIHRQVGTQEPTTVWGMVPVITTLATQGTAVAADWTQAVLWVRSGVVVSTTNSHSDWFLKGLIAMKAEYRAAFDVLQEAAFIKITGL